jgi:hypothetical protein
MMARKSPFTPKVYDAWDKLVLDNGAKLSLDQRYKGWQELHDVCFQNGKWLVGFDDAGLAASLGSTLAMETKDWSSARLLANQFLSHPEAAHFPKDPHLPSAHRIEIAAGILCGDIVASSKKCLRLVDEKAFGRWSKTFLLTSISHLNGVLSELDPNCQISPDLRNYAFELVKRFSGFKKRANEVLTMTTNRQVICWVEGILRENWDRNKVAWTKRVKRLHPEFEG